jgi:hypothetical protein
MSDSSHVATLRNITFRQKLNNPHYAYVSCVSEAQCRDLWPRHETSPTVANTWPRRKHEQAGKADASWTQAEPVAHPLAATLLKKD